MMLVFFGQGPSQLRRALIVTSGPRPRLAAVRSAAGDRLDSLAGSHARATGAFKMTAAGAPAPLHRDYR